MAAAKTERSGGVCVWGMRGVCVGEAWCLAPDERTGVTLNANTGLLEVVIVDANNRLIVVMV